MLRFELCKNYVLLFFCICILPVVNVGFPGWLKESSNFVTTIAKTYSAASDGSPGLKNAYWRKGTLFNTLVQDMSFESML